MTTRKTTRSRRIFSVEEKVKAVPAVWTEQKSSSQVCREMKVGWSLLDRWQNQAMEGMLSALAPKKKTTPSLNGRLSKLLEKGLSARGSGMMKLGERLETVQRKRRNKESA